MASVLTTRELEVLKLVADGTPNKKIARQLSISTETVKDHVSNILGKLHANDRAHAVAIAIRQQLILV